MRAEGEGRWGVQEERRGGEKRKRGRMRMQKKGQRSRESREGRLGSVKMKEGRDERRCRRRE